MSNDTATETVACHVDTIPDKTPVRYEGSIEQFRGRYGWVKASYQWHGQTRYTVIIGKADDPRNQMDLVRRTSLVTGADLT